MFSKLKLLVLFSFFLACTPLAKKPADETPYSRGPSRPLGFIPPSTPSLNSDWTYGTVPPGWACTRTGGIFYTQTGPRSVVQNTAGCLIEDRGDGAGWGVWNVEAFTNEAPNPFTFTTAAGWSYVSTDAGPFLVPNDAVAPDGTSTMTRFTDPTITFCDYLRATGTAPTTTISNVGSLWYKDYAPSPPTIPGAISVTAPNASNFLSALGPSNPLRRVSHINPNSGANHSAINIYVAGLVPNGNGSTMTNAATGSGEIWGAQITQAEGDMPLLTGSPATTTATVIQPTVSLAGMLQPGANDVNISVTFVNDPAQVVFPVTDTRYAVSFTTADGASGAYFESSTTITASVNGVPAGSKSFVTFANYGAIPITVDLFSSASLNISGANMWVGGCRLAGQSSNRAGYQTIHTPTGVWLGSNQAIAGSYIPRRFLIANLASSLSPNRGEGVILSDSIIAPYLGKPSACAWIYTASEALTRPGIVSQATPGNTILQQYAFWIDPQYNQLRGAASLKWVLIQLGVNDGIANRTETQMAADMNTLIANINAANPTAKILLYPVVPGHGGSGGLTDAQWTQVSAFNADIEGVGAHAIVGSNIIIGSRWTELQEPGTNGQLAVWADSGDGIHTNYQARAWQGAKFGNDLHRAGLK